MQAMEKQNFKFYLIQINLNLIKKNGYLIDLLENFLSIFAQL